MTEEWIGGFIPMSLMMFAIGSILSASAMALQKNCCWSLLLVRFMNDLVWNFAHFNARASKKQLQTSKNKAEHNEARDWISLLVNLGDVLSFFEACRAKSYATMVALRLRRYANIEEEHKVLDYDFGFSCYRGAINLSLAINSTST